MTGEPTALSAGGAAGEGADPLLVAVAAWIGEAAAKLQGRDAFNARVAQRALAIARRELAQRAGAEAVARTRLAALLGRDGTFEALDAALRARLQTGDLKPETPAVLDHLRRSALERLAIDQPDYAHEGLASGPERPA